MDIKRITWEELFVENAILFSKRSTCNRLHVGCVLVKDNHVISSGYNGFLPGVIHKSAMRDGHEQNTVHAEANCIADCAKRGISVDKCIAYVTHYPCMMCAKLMLASGISSVFYLNDYNNDELVEELFKSFNRVITKINNKSNTVSEINKTIDTSPDKTDIIIDMKLGVTDTITTSTSTSTSTSSMYSNEYDCLKTYNDKSYCFRN